MLKIDNIIKLYEIYIKYLLIIFPILLISGPALINFFNISICVYAILNFKECKKLIYSKNRFFLLIALSLIFVFPYDSINFQNSFIKFIGFIKFPLLFFGVFIYLNRKPEHVLNFRKYWLLILLLISFDVLKEYITGTNLLGFSSIYTGRIASFTNDELIIGYIYIFLFLFCIPIIRKEINKNFLLILITFFFIVISFIIGERSNFIKFFLFAILNFLIFFPLKSFLKSMIAVSILVFSILFFLNKTPQYQKLFPNIVLNYNAINFISFKNKIYENKHAPHYFTAIEIVKNYPYFGIGLNNFHKESSKEIYKDEKFKFNDNRSSTHPHNTHFEIASELGLFGYFYFLILFIVVIQKFLSKKFFRLNIININHFFLFIFFIIPILPTGSFFGTISGTVFWLNLSFLLYYIKK